MRWEAAHRRSPLGELRRRSADGRSYNRIIVIAVDRCKEAAAPDDQALPPLRVAFDPTRIPMAFPDLRTPFHPSRLGARARRARRLLPASAQMAKLPAAPPGSAVATFAGGCFWCMEQPFDKQDGRHRHDVRLHRRDESEADVRGSVERQHRPYRSRAGALRPEEGVVREAARHLLAQHRSDGEGPPVLRRRQPVPDRDLRAHDEQRSAAEARRPRSRKRSRSRNRSSRRSSPRPSSGRPRNTTRTTTGRTRCATPTIAPAAAATRA